MAGDIIGGLGALSTAASVGSLVADIIRDLTGRPCDSKVIATAIRDGLYRIAESSDGIAEALSHEAEAKLVRAETDRILAEKELTLAKRELTDAHTLLVNAKTALTLARTGLERERAMRMRDTAEYDLRILLPRLRAFMSNYDALVAEPLKQIIAPGA